MNQSQYKQPPRVDSNYYEEEDSFEQNRRQTPPPPPLYQQEVKEENVRRKKRHTVLYALMAAVLIASAGITMGVYMPSRTQDPQPTIVVRSDDEKRAFDDAKFYYDTLHMSKQGIFDQMTQYGEHYSDDLTERAIENLNADWKENALKKAKDLKKQHISKESMFETLTTGYGAKYTEEEAQYALDHLEVNWEEEALSEAKHANSLLHKSKKGLFRYLTSGCRFTEEEAQYAMDHLGDINWKENALENGKSYRRSINMNKEELFQQLTSEFGEAFTDEEAQYAIDHIF